jgi:hypothetical protein
MIPVIGGLFCIQEYLRSHRTSDSLGIVTYRHYNFLPYFCSRGALRNLSTDKGACEYLGIVEPIQGE